jgi:hypothetical protein
VFRDAECAHFFGRILSSPARTLARQETRLYQYYVVVDAHYRKKHIVFVDSVHKPQPGRTKKSVPACKFRVLCLVLISYSSTLTKTPDQDSSLKVAYQQTQTFVVPEQYHVKIQNIMSISATQAPNPITMSKTSNKRCIHFSRRVIDTKRHITRSSSSDSENSTDSEMEQISAMEQEEPLSPPDLRLTPCIRPRAGRRIKRVSFMLPEGHCDGERPISASSCEEDNQQRLMEKYEKHRRQMYCFMKVLFIFLQKTDQGLLEAAMQTVHDCHCRHKNQEPGFEALSCALERTLQQTVGKCIWRKVMYYHIRIQTVQSACCDEST